MWTVEYQLVKGGPWIFAGVWAPTADRAWESFTLLRLHLGFDYYAAQAIGPPASLYSIELSGQHV
jgi:hypothetical protein